MNTLKTTNLGRLAKYLIMKYGIKSRLISADNEWDSIDDCIADGYIDPLSILAFDNPFPVLTKLSQGQWLRYNANRRKLEWFQTPQSDLEKLAYLIEGTTTIGELLMQDHVSKARVIGQDVVGKFEEAAEPGDTAFTYANPAQSHHYNVQTFVTMSLIPDFMMLPVKWVWWTGHEYRGEDEATKQRMLGPGVTGKAVTTKVPRKVGNCLHMDMVEQVSIDPQTKRTRRVLDHRAYYEPHADAESPSLKWPAGLKMPASWVPAWRERFPEGYIPLTLDQGVEVYLAFHDEMAAKAGITTVGQAGGVPVGSAVEGGGAVNLGGGGGAPVTPAVTKPEPFWKQRAAAKTAASAIPAATLVEVPAAPAAAEEAVTEPQKTNEVTK
jgi:hypothetical protein